MKSLFTNINTYEFNSQEDFYKSIVEELKSCDWVKARDSDKYLCESVPYLTFYKMTAIDYRYFEDKNICFRYEIFYTKGVDNQYTWEVNFYENEERQYNDYLIVENDDLGLFSRPEEQKEEPDWRDVLSYTLNKILQSESVEDVVDYIDNNFASISDKVRENCIDNLVASDIDDSLKEDIARDWIDDNSGEAFDRAWDNMDSYDIKNKIIDYLADNL
jgi:hypothetical protein